MVVDVDARRWAPPKKVGVLSGGRSTERAISLITGEAMRAALVTRGYDVAVIDVAESPCQRIQAAAVDVAVIALHGRWGEDGCIQGLLESLAIPYTGAGVLASAVALDKLTSKRLFEGAGLATPRWVYPATFETALDLGLPLVLKPRAGGSSVGLEVVADEAALERTLAATREPSSVDAAGGQISSAAGIQLANGLLAEQYIPGHELTVAVLGQGDAARALGTLEIRPANGLYDYQAKYETDDTEYLVPAPFSAGVRERLAELAVAAHRLLDCCGATRVDFRWATPERRATEPMLLEVNTLPGMTSHSLLPKIAVEAGQSYEDLVEWILADASLKA